MWIATLTGYFSVLLVRSRVFEDADRLSKATGSPVEHNRLADYPYRSRLTRSQLRTFLTDEIERLDYDNFKNAVNDEEPARALIYGRVWNALKELEEL
jgi:hypothetical protein